MGETVLLVTLVVVLFLITVVSVLAMVKLRRKTDSANVDNLDAGFDICISELNKMGSLIKSDIEAKYKEILFLYELIEDRHRQIEALVSKKEDKVSLEKRHVEEKRHVGEEFHVEEGRHVEEERPGEVEVKPDYKAILQMSERGLGIADIARELGIGQGEVKLILNIASK